jgi:hypothetical protein
MASRSSQYTKKGNFCSESSQEADKCFYKRLQLAFVNLSSAGDQAQCPKYVGKCWATEPYPQSSGDKQNFNPPLYSPP